MDFHALQGSFLKDPGHIVGCMVVYDNANDTDVPFNAEVSPSGRLVNYSKTPVPGLTHVEAGVLVFRRSLLDHVPANTKYSLEKDVYPELVPRGMMTAFACRDRFYDIGTPSRLAEFEEVLARDNI